MKCFVLQVIIVTAVVVCAGNDCDFNEDLSALHANGSQLSYVASHKKSFHFNAKDEKFDEDFFCDEDDVVEDVEDRDGFELSCASSLVTAAPNKLKNYKKQIRNVVNNPYIEQKISYVKCSEKNSKCEHGENSPEGFAYVCRQKYVKMTLKAFDDASGQMIEDQFPIPSYCACEYVRKK